MYNQMLSATFKSPSRFIRFRNTGYPFSQQAMDSGGLPGFDLENSDRKTSTPVQKTEGFL
jgi:hypothetical protein